MMLTVRGVRRRQESERRRETVENGGARSPSRDMSAMCADETGRCAKPGFDRHLSSYQRAPEELQRPAPGRLWLGINARITSASYRGLSRPVSCHELRTILEPRKYRLTASPSDTFANGRKMSSCFVTFNPLLPLTTYA